MLPYLLLGVVWVFSNPAGAAPDESDHLIKAIAAGRLDIGVPYSGSGGTAARFVRNDSISRTVQIPANLVPSHFACVAFHPDTTATCQPTVFGTSTDPVAATTTVGAYPVFMYVPIGVAARFAGDPQQAFHLARLAALAMSIALLFLAIWQLTRFLGRGAAVGLAVGLTPTAIFASSAVSTSGVEIMSAAAVAAVVVVGTRRPSTLADPGTLLVLAIAGSALVLSRQLGVIALAIFAIIALCRGGARVLWDQIRRRHLPTIAAVAIVGLCAVATLVWELNYDHPALVGPVLSADAFGAFLGSGFYYVRTGIGTFGWLDTPLPGQAFALWIVVASIVVGGALLVGRRADRLTIAGALIAIVIVTYVTHATVFYPVRGGVQGRHLLPMFMIVPSLAGVVLAEQLQRVPRLASRLAVLVGTAMAALQLFSLLVNGRRYAVGADGPIWFLPSARWSPAGGWWPWLIAATAAACLLAVMIIRGGRSPIALPHPVRPVPVHSEPAHSDSFGPDPGHSDAAHSDPAHSDPAHSDPVPPPTPEQEHVER